MSQPITLPRWVAWLLTAAAICGYAILALLAASQLTACGGGDADESAADAGHRGTQPPACQANPASCK